MTDRDVASALREQVQLRRLTFGASQITVDIDDLDALLEIAEAAQPPVKPEMLRYHLCAYCSASFTGLHVGCILPAHDRLGSFTECAGSLTGEYRTVMAENPWSRNR